MRGPAVGGRAGLRLLLGLLAASVAAVTFAVVRANADGTAPDGTLTSPADRTSAMHRLARVTAKALSYRAGTFEADIDASGAMMTGRMRAEYLAALQPVKADVVHNGITLKATVVETSLITQTDRTIRGLLFVDRVTTSTGSAKERVDNSRVVVTMLKQGDRWLISKMDAF